MSDLPSKEELVEGAAKALWKLDCAKASADEVRDGREPPASWANPWHELGYGKRQRERYEQDATTILDAILPLVMRGPVEALGQSLRQWKLYADCFDPEHGNLDTDRTPEGDLYRHGHSALQWAEKIGGG